MVVFFYTFWLYYVYINKLCNTIQLRQSGDTFSTYFANMYSLYIYTNYDFEMLFSTIPLKWHVFFRWNVEITVCQRMLEIKPT